MAQAPTARVWAEIGYHNQRRFTIVTPTLGVGLMVAPSIELEAIVPLAYVSDSQESGAGGGNLYVGFDYVRLDSPRVKLGAGLALPTAARHGMAGEANELGLAPDAFQQAYYRLPDAFGIVAPLRIEGGSSIVGSLDVDIAFLIATKRGAFGNDDTQLITDFAPGIGGYATPELLFGVRAPMFWAATSSARDNAQVAIEPFFRGQLDSGFFDVRVTIPIDEPLGFAFERGKFWGLHFGGGAAF